VGQILPNNGVFFFFFFLSYLAKQSPLKVIPKHRPLLKSSLFNFFLMHFKTYLVEREIPARAESREWRERDTGRARSREAVTKREGSIDRGGRWIVESRRERERESR
jgi:hypothetical protein